MSKNLGNQEIVKTNTILSVEAFLLLLLPQKYRVVYSIVCKKFLCTSVLFISFITYQTTTKSDNVDDKNTARETE